MSGPLAAAVRRMREAWPDGRTVLDTEAFFAAFADAITLSELEEWNTTVERNAQEQLARWDFDKGATPNT